MSPRILTFRDINPSFEVTETYLLEEIKKIPLELVLGSVAVMCSDIKSDEGFFNTRFQGRWLSLVLEDSPPELVDDLIQRVGAEEPLVFIHEQNLNWLVDQALCHSDSSIVTEEISVGDIRKVAHLLLLFNNLIRFPDRPSEFKDLKSRHSFCVGHIRNYQFNSHFQLSKSQWASELARNTLLFSEYLPIPSLFPRIRTIVEEQLGFSIEYYFQALALLQAFILEELTPDEDVISLSRFVSNLQEPMKTYFITLLRMYSCSPKEYIEIYQHWIEKYNSQITCPENIRIPLQRTPIFRIRNDDQIVMPIPQLVLRKSFDEALYIAFDSGRLDSGEQQGGLPSKLGKAFEHYGADIVKRFTDIQGWKFHHSPKEQRKKTESEITDVYIQKGDVGILIEFKGGRPGLPFLHGDNNDCRVLGPGKEALERLDQERIPVQDMANLDQGYITKSIWQINARLTAVKQWAEEHFDQKPNKLFAMTVLLSDYLPDETVLNDYIIPLMERVEFDEEVLIPQFIHIRSFELLFELITNDNSVNLATLLEVKDTVNPIVRFDAILQEIFSEKDCRPHHTLVEKAKELLNSAAAHFRSNT